jgi:hypothetical protein
MGRCPTLDDPLPGYAASVSSADQILSAKISAVCRRHCARGRIEDQDQAVAELRASNRPDLLAQHAGLALGRAQAGRAAQAPGYQAEAELCRAAGADEAAIGQWIAVGRQRAEQSQQQPYAAAP